MDNEKAMREEVENMQALQNICAICGEEYTDAERDGSLIINIDGVDICCGCLRKVHTRED
jgi:hypothetical protein